MDAISSQHTHTNTHTHTDTQHTYTKNTLSRNMNEFIEIKGENNQRIVKEVIEKRIERIFEFEHSERSMSTTDCLQSKS